jgi:hypothetical protein
MLKSLFKPKWQHPDQTIRQKALSNFDPEQDLELIKKMAFEDPSTQLREQALNKVTDVELLTDLLKHRTTPDDWFRIALRINQLSPQLDKLVISFSQISSAWTNEVTLQAIAGCKDSELATALVFSTNDAEALVDLAISAKSIDLRLNAVEKINDLEKLQFLSKKATNKLVIKAVKAKLNAAKDKQQQIDHTLEQAERLLGNIKKLSQQSWFDSQYESKLTNLISHWQALDLLILQNNHEFETAFESALTDCKKIIATHQQQFEQQALEQDAVNKQKGLCAELEKLINEMNSSSMQSIDLFQSIKGALKILDDNWVQIVDTITPKAEIKKQYEGLRKRLCSHFNYWENLIEWQPEIEQHILVVPDKTYLPLKSWLEKWQQLESKLQWPGNIEKPTILLEWLSITSDYQASYNKIVESQKKKSHYINKKLHLLEKHCNQKNLIAANKLINYIEARAEVLISDFKVSYQKKLEHILPQLEELRDWHSFATKPKKESLCNEMESLQSLDMEPLEKARQVRELQTQWRGLAASNSVTDEQLWERFKLASDLAYLPCLKYYAEQDKVKAENLKQKVKVCEALEALEALSLSANPDAINVDWKTLENTLNNTAQSWKENKAVPENEKQSINNRYHDITKLIRNQLKTEKQKNLELRCELIEKAEKLVELEDNNQAVSQAITLQKQWKTIGITFFKADREKWQQFRSVLDKVFEKRDSIKNSFKAELKVNQQELESITQEIIQLKKLDDNQLKASYDEFIELKQSWSHDAELPRASAKKVQENFENACSEYQAHYAGLNDRLSVKRLKAIFQCMSKIEKIEEKLITEHTAITDEELAALNKEFELLADNQKLKVIFKERIETLSKGSVFNVNSDGLVTLQALALDAEITLGISSPEEFKSQRMALQLKQLENGIGQNSADVDKQKIVWDMFHCWLKIGFIDKESRQQLETRRSNIFKSAED